MTLTAASFASVQNATPSDIAKLNSALSYLSTSTLANDTLQQAAAAGTTIVILRPGDPDGDHISPDQKTLYWDPDSGLIVTSADGTTGVQSSALGLLHEAFHITDPSYKDPSTIAGNKDDETWAVGETNIAAGQLGEPQSVNHAGTEIYAADPLEHTVPSENGGTDWVTQAPGGGQTILGNYQDGSTPMYAPIPQPALGSAPAQQVWDYNGNGGWYLVVPDGKANTFQITENIAGSPKINMSAYDTVIPVNADGSADIIGPAGTPVVHFSDASQIQFSGIGTSSITASAPSTVTGAPTTSVTFTSTTVGQNSVTIITPTTPDSTGKIPEPFAEIQSTDASASSSNGTIAHVSPCIAHGAPAPSAARHQAGTDDWR